MKRIVVFLIMLAVALVSKTVWGDYGDDRFKGGSYDGYTECITTGVGIPPPPPSGTVIIIM